MELASRCGLKMLLWLLHWDLNVVAGQAVYLAGTEIPATTLCRPLCGINRAVQLSERQMLQEHGRAFIIDPSVRFGHRVWGSLRRKLNALIAREVGAWGES